MAKREFLKLAHVFDPKKHRCAGMFMSEKLDGQRAFWDGGVSRGLVCGDVPWANVAKGGTLHVATGLWSRYGKAIFAPDSWIDQLPSLPLDGELYCAAGRQTGRSIIARHEPDARWDTITYNVFGSPPLANVFGDGTINSLHYKKRFLNIKDWLPAKTASLHPLTNFTVMDGRLSGLACGDVLHVLDQHKLPIGEPDALRSMHDYMDSVVSRGGEGLILQSPFSLWSPERSWDTLKVKPENDAEAHVVGYTWGKRGVEDRLLGLMGSLVCRYNGIVFSLSGFMESERELVVTKAGLSARAIGCEFPGSPVCDSVSSVLFPRQSTITFKYRSLTDDGVPVEARYLRT